MNIFILIFSVCACISIIIGVVLAVNKFYKNKKEEGFAMLLFSTGMSLILSASPGNLNDFLVLIAVVTKYRDAQALAGTFNYFYFILGVVLLVISVWLHIYVKKKIYVLNINGYMPKKLEDYFKDLKMSNFEFKEREIDFINIYKNMFCGSLNENAFECIKKDIEEKVKAFKNESKGIKRGYTGIAPIPFIMYAGTFLERENIDEYYEFDKKEIKTYYKLTKDINFSKIKLISDIDCLNKANTEVVLAISLTQSITDSDLEQFINMDKVYISINNPHDNAIKSKQQLNSYCNFILEKIEDISKEIPNLNKIHIVYSGQSCLALEIGKRSIDDTRLPEIVNYQYERQGDKKYPWGIVINGRNKGNLIKA